MPRFSMKLTASVIGSLALLAAAACEQRSETTPAPEQITSPSAASSGTPSQSVDSLNPPQRTMPGVSVVPADEAQPVSGTDEEPMGGGGMAGAGGHGHGHGGKSGHP